MGDSYAGLFANAMWKNQLDRIMDVLPVLIVGSLGFALPFWAHKFDRAVSFAYGFITFYELLKLYYKAPEFGVESDQTIFGAIRGSHHFYRAIVAVIFLSMDVSSVCFELSELIYFSIRSFCVILIELGVHFPKKRLIFMTIKSSAKNANGPANNCSVACRTNYEFLLRFRPLGRRASLANRTRARIVAFRESFRSMTFEAACHFSRTRLSGSVTVDMNPYTFSKLLIDQD
jgi:hypothetical protein